MNRHNTALRFAGITAIGTACYHAIEGDSIIRAIEMSDDDMSFVTGTFQLGTMGWIAGGVLLVAAATMDSAKARNWIVGVTVALYGLPAFGTLALTGGRPSVGGVALAIATALAVYGRTIEDAATAERPVASAEQVAAPVIPRGC